MSWSVIWRKRSELQQELKELEDGTRTAELNVRREHAGTMKWKIWNESIKSVKIRTRSDVPEINGSRE